MIKLNILHILLIIFCILIIYMIVNKTKNKESFQNNNNNKITYIKCNYNNNYPRLSYFTFYKDINFI